MEEPLYKELAYRTVGVFYQVYNELGPGYKESVYQKALAREFSLQGLVCEEGKRLAISYKGYEVGIYIPDFIIEDKIIIEIKAVPEMPPVFEKQLYYYLKGTKYKLGYLVNFGGGELDVKRRIFDKARNANK